MDNLFSFLIAAFIIGAFLLYYLNQEKKKAAATLEAAEKGKLRSDGPQSQHPHIDNTHCIGCATCTMVCPEGDVLGMVGGKAMSRTMVRRPWAVWTRTWRRILKRSRMT